MHCSVIKDMHNLHLTLFPQAREGHMSAFCVTPSWSTMVCPALLLQVRLHSMAWLRPTYPPTLECVTAAGAVLCGGESRSKSFFTVMLMLH